MIDAVVSRSAQRAIWAVAFTLLSLVVVPCRAETPVVVQPIPPEIISGMVDLKTAGADARQKTFDLIAEKGDARLIPALKAYKDNLLLLRDGKLMTYGDRLNVPDKGSVVPLIDAITSGPILGPDGQPIYYAKPDLSGSLRAPRGADRKTVNDLIASLSLLDPDPTVRTASIRDAAERAARAIPDPADAVRFMESLTTCSVAINALLAQTPTGDVADSLRAAVAAISAAQADRSTTLTTPAPSASVTGKVDSALHAAQDANKDLSNAALSDALAAGLASVATYQARVDLHGKVLEDLPKTLAALKRQLEKDPKSHFASALNEAIYSIELVTSDDEQVKITAAAALGKIATSRAANLLEKITEASQRLNDAQLHEVAARSLHTANTYQKEVTVIQDSFAGLSLGSILVLMALGLSIIFGLMGVINMAQGEFMMVGAFTTFAVAQFFKQHFGPEAYNYYLIAAVPLAFLSSAVIGYIVESLVVRHLYGRPLDSLLATWGIGLVLVWAVRWKFGDNESIKPPRWMEGGWEVAPDIVFPLNRVYIIAFCVICILVVYFVVNGTKLGLLLRATTQNRDMAAALGVATRRIDGLTFAFGAGLAGLAGVAVPLYDKINPDMGQAYIVDCFMVVVVGGVGKIAGAIWAGFGFGFIQKYLEPILGMFPSMASGASVIGKVIVLCLIIIFLQWRPQGLFPPKGRNADA